MGMPWRVRRCLFSPGQGIASNVGEGSLQPPCSRSLVDGTPKTGVWSPLLCLKTGATEHINRGHARSDIEFQSNGSIADTSQIETVIVTCCCYQMDLPARSGDCVAGPDDAGAFETAKRSGPQRRLLSSRGPGFAILPSIRNGRRCSARPWKAHLKDTYPHLLQPQKKKRGAVEGVGSQRGSPNQARLPYVTTRSAHLTQMGGGRAKPWRRVVLSGNTRRGRKPRRARTHGVDRG